MASDSTLQLIIKKLPLTKLGCTMKEYPQLYWKVTKIFLCPAPFFVRSAFLHMFEPKQQSTAD